MCIDMGWWNTGGDFTDVDGVSGDLPWDFAGDWIRAYVERFDRAPKRSEVMGAFEAMFHSRIRTEKAHTGWCDEDLPVELLDE